MGFKLGTERGNYAVSGEIRTKFRFHKEAGGDLSVPGTPIIRKDLGPDILGEANMDGTIYINENIEDGSPLQREVLQHEMMHATKLKTEEHSYTYNSITINGVTYARSNGNIFYNGEWLPEGDPSFPWEQHL